MNTKNLKFVESMLNDYAEKVGTIEKIVKHLEKNAIIEFQKKPMIGVISPEEGVFQNVRIERFYAIRKMTSCYYVEETVRYVDDSNTTVFTCHETNNFEDPNDFIKDMVEMLANVDQESIIVAGYITSEEVEGECTATDK